MSSPYEPPLRVAAEAALTYLHGVGDRPVGPEASEDELEAALGGPLPEEATDPVETLQCPIAGVEPGLLQFQGPRFFGFVNGGAHLAALAAGDG